MRIVDLPRPGNPSLRVRLAAITGRDELTVSVGNGRLALDLLGRLATDETGAPLVLEQLSVSEADRLLATLYDELYGDRAECRMRCSECGQAYEFTLKLPELIAAQDAARPEPPGSDGTWTLPDGRKIRAPLLADLAAADGPEALIPRLVVAGDPDADPDLIAEFLEQAAPTLSLDLDASCPHCQAAELVRFDLARYLAARIAGERPFLVRETHLIASRYGWSHGEVMALTRSDRRAYAGLIEAERASGQRMQRSA